MFLNVWQTLVEINEATENTEFRNCLFAIVLFLKVIRLL